MCEFEKISSGRGNIQKVEMDAKGDQYSYQETSNFDAISHKSLLSLVNEEAFVVFIKILSRLIDKSFDLRFCLFVKEVLHCEMSLRRDELMFFNDSEFG